MIFQSGARQTVKDYETLKNHKNAQNLAKKNKEKPCSTCLKPIFWVIARTRSATTYYPKGAFGVRKKFQKTLILAIEEFVKQQFVLR